jgi:hypothetical protein
MTATSPFEIPEILLNIARFLPKGDYAAVILSS